MIILTASEAEKVRGLSPLKGGAALDPVPLKDDTFMLGEQVLDDPAHADVRDLLASLPTVKAVDESLLFIEAEDGKAGNITPEDRVKLEALPKYQDVGERKPLTTEPAVKK